MLLHICNLLSFSVFPSIRSFPVPFSVILISNFSSLYKFFFKYISVNEHKVINIVINIMSMKIKLNVNLNKSSMPIKMQESASLCLAFGECNRFGSFLLFWNDFYFITIFTNISSKPRQNYSFVILFLSFKWFKCFEWSVLKIKNLKSGTLQND